MPAAPEVAAVQLISEISRTAMIATGSHQKTSLATRHDHGAEHEELVGQRVEERAAAGGALRRASQPSMPSVMASTIQSASAGHDAPPVSTIEARSTGVTAQRGPA